MIKNIIPVILAFFFFVPAVQASDITLSVNQSDYYFVLGEQATVPLEIKNTYGKQVNGVLGYTITQEINQQGFKYSSSSTKSTSFSLDNGESTVSLGFGTSDTPMTLRIMLTFSYNEKEQREVTLDGINVHFVAKESDKNNKQNSMKSSSQSQQPSQQGQNIQEMIDQMFNNQQHQQDPQQQLQNNQLTQDSSALKQQMEKQLKEQDQLKEEFRKQLSHNEKFQEQNQELTDMGYNLKNAGLDPSSNNSGTFEYNYQKENGDQATLKGEMQDGELTSLQKQTAEDRKRLLEELNQSSEFQKYSEQLKEQGFTRQNTEFSQEGNITNVKMNYMNGDNKKASIKAEFVNGSIKKIELEKENDLSDLLLLLLSLLPVCAIGYILYRKYTSRPVRTGNIEQAVIERPFDHVAGSRNLIEEAKQLFEDKKYKDAYGKAGQAIRLFLSYENKLDKEITNDELIQFLSASRKDHAEIKKCLDMCSLVEFAKYEANREDFDTIISTAKSVIENKRTH